MKPSVGDLQTVLAIGVIALAVGATAPRAQAGELNEWTKLSIITVNEPVQVSDAVLQPGKYILRVLDSEGDRHTVQIFNGTQSHLVDTVFAYSKQRLWEQRTSKQQFTFWETPPGTAKALRAWFYPGDTVGQEFPYPKHPYQIASAEAAPEPDAGVMPPTPAVAVPDPEPAAPAEPTPDLTPAPPPAPPEPAATVVPDDNTPNPPAPPAAVEPEQAPPAELPKTASPYPAMGFTGVILLALAGLIGRRLSA